jgi:hypothetical protein
VTITTASAFTAEPGATSVTVTYPAGSAGDTLLVWLSVATTAAVTVSGNLTSAEQVGIISSTGRLFAYKRVRQSGDTSATFTTASTARKIAIVANLSADLDDAAPTTTAGFGASSLTVSPASDPAGPGLLAVWFTFSNIALDPAGTVLESPSPDGDVTVGFELRLFQIAAETDISQTTPTNPSNSLAIRAVSYTTIGAVVQPWTVGRVSWGSRGAWH